ncbi:MAG: aminopeptidase P family protein [Phycisphaerales bacterium]|nr:MAG: aminopeptidase P family protein [Phycisphaerales bacterium]
MNKAVIAGRIRTVRRQMSKKRIGCLIITKPANVTYVTGFQGDDSWAVIAAGRVYLLTDSRYTEQAEKECPSCRIIDRAGPMAEAVARLAKRVESVRTVTVEESTSLGDFKRLKESVKARLRTASHIIETARSTKDASEIAVIRRAASISTEALEQTLSHIKPGVTESELAGMLDFQIRKLGARNSFETIVAFGPNASRPHHQPGARKLKKKDTVLIDFGARYKGYCSDITRCFAIGGMTALYKKVYDVVEQAQAAAIKAVKAGVKITQVDAVARQVIAESDLPVYGHGTGHGFGIEIHESPFLKADAKGTLEAGQVITIEPGVYMPGKLGVRIEDDILVTDSGRKILTPNCPHSPFLPIAVRDTKGKNKQYVT